MADDEEQKWDDEELTNSWEDAVKEYQKYHSMAAKGEKVNLLTLKTAITSAEQPNGAPKQQTTPNAPPNFAAGPAAATVAHAPPMPPAGLANMPQALVNSSQSEQLKNIMTAWYYAGYYTGFYDGQQNAWSNMPQQG